MKNLRIGLLLILLSGCSAKPHYAPVSDHARPLNLTPDTHQVHAGETLYYLSWLYGIDHRVIASTNGLQPPYRIYPGQKIVLNANTNYQGKAAATAKNRAASSSSGVKSRPSQTVVKRSTVNQNHASGALRKPPPSNVLKKQKVHWQWPLKGKLVKRFSLTGSINKGIDLQTKLGESVRASRAGYVVYAGAGLVGYGQLVIIKHDEEYLSAYGYNRRLVVKEGQFVKAGEKIAEVGKVAGSFGDDSAQLHFEIRYDGLAVDPLKLLPRQ